MDLAYMDLQAYNLDLNLSLEVICFELKKVSMSLQQIWLLCECIKYRVISVNVSIMYIW